MADQEQDISGVDQLLTAYEKGKVTRRQLLTSLVLAGAGSAAGAESPAFAQATKSPLSGRASRAQHINFKVANLRKTVEFYAKLGMPSTPRPMFSPPGSAAYALDFTNGSYMSLIQEPDPKKAGRIDHFCIGIDNFDWDKDRAAIKAAGIDFVETDFNLLHIIDPDGIPVQMTDSKQSLDCPRGIGYPPCGPWGSRSR